MGVAGVGGVYQGMSNYGGNARNNASGQLSDWGTVATNTMGFTNPHAKDAQAAYQESLGHEVDTTKGILSGMQGAGQNYANTMSGLGQGYLKATGDYTNSFMGQSQALANQAKDQATNAKTTYSNNILPNQQQLMDQAIDNAQGAMTLKQAQDPNNAVASGVRNLYNTEGQSEQDIYNKQAQGFNKMGQADYGVLAALGSQATQGQIGQGMPMTGGQLQAIQGANLGQAGQAFANTQQYVNALKQQGIAANAGLRQQGLGAGIQQSNTMYGLGQAANQAAQGAVGQYAGLYGQGQGLQQQAMGIQNGLNQQMYGTQMGQAGTGFNVQASQAGLQNQLAQQAGQENIGLANMQYGGQQGVDLANLQAANANAAGRSGLFGTLLGTGLGIGMGGVGGGGAGGGGGVGGTAQMAQTYGGAFRGVAGQTGQPQQQGGYGQGGYGYQPANPYGQQQQPGY